MDQTPASATNVNIEVPLPTSKEEAIKMHGDLISLLRQQKEYDATIFNLRKSQQDLEQAQRNLEQERNALARALDETKIQVLTMAAGQGPRGPPVQGHQGQDETRPAPAEPARPKGLPSCRFGNTSQEDWRIFRGQFEDSVHFFGYTNDQAKFALFCCLKANAARCVADLRNQDRNQSYLTLLDLCQARFLPPAHSSVAQGIFEQAHQVQGETILEWHGRLRAFFNNAFPDNAVDNPILIRKFAKGLMKDNITRQVLRERPETYELALHAARNEESVLCSTASNFDMMAAKVGARQALNKKEAVEPMEIGQLSKYNKGNLSCHNCNEKGHFIRDCPQPKKKNGSSNGNALKKKFRSWRKAIQEMSDNIDKEDGPHQVEDEPDKEEEDEFVDLTNDSEEEEDSQQDFL